MQIVALDRLVPVLEPKLRAAGVDARLTGVPASGALPPEAADAEIFYYNYAFPRRIIADAIRAMPKLRWIHAINAGVDHLLCPELV